MDATPQRELPRYKCHKEVGALKIKEMAVEVDGRFFIVPEDQGYAPFPVTPGYVTKNRPVAGGYFVLYNDGYQSFSPAEAFEEGYTLITP